MGLLFFLVFSIINTINVNSASKNNTTSNSNIKSSLLISITSFRKKGE